MAIHDRDLLLIQRLSEPFKIEAQAAKAYFDTPLPVATRSQLGGVKAGSYVTIDSNGLISADIPHVLRFKGLVAASADAPAGPSEGDVWVFNSDGSLNSSWGRLQGETVNSRDMVLWDGVQWDIIGETGSGIGLAGLTYDYPVFIDSSIPHQPHIGIHEATTNGKLGVVRLATAQDVALGSYGAVVDAAQLKVVADRIAAGGGTGTGTGTGTGITAGAIPANTFMPYDITTLRTLP